MRLPTPAALPRLHTLNALPVSFQKSSSLLEAGGAQLSWQPQIWSLPILRQPLLLEVWPPPEDEETTGESSADDSSTENHNAMKPFFLSNESKRAWWQRPPPTWPPRVDDPVLVAGDMLTTYLVAYTSLVTLTTGREGQWLQEGSALASAWIVAAAVTNAWDPTAVLPSLGLPNALGCVARAAIDFSSSRLFFALVGAVAARQAVDVKLLLLELSLGSVVLALWRCLYTATNPDRR